MEPCLQLQVLRHLINDNRLLDGMKPVVADKLSCYQIYIKTNWYSSIQIMQNREQFRQDN